MPAGQRRSVARVSFLTQIFPQAVLSPATLSGAARPPRGTLFPAVEGFVSVTRRLRRIRYRGTTSAWTSVALLPWETSAMECQLICYLMTIRSVAASLALATSSRQTKAQVSSAHPLIDLIILTATSLARILPALEN